MIKILFEEESARLKNEYNAVVLVISHFLHKLDRKLRIPGLSTGSTFE